MSDLVISSPGGVSIDFSVHTYNSDCPSGEYDCACICDGDTEIDECEKVQAILVAIEMTKIIVD